jgi:hypothetical protein
MSTVAEIEAAIEKLPSTDFGELLAWIDDYRAMLSGSRRFSPCTTRRSKTVPRGNRGEVWMADLGMIATEFSPASACPNRVWARRG